VLPDDWLSVALEPPRAHGEPLGAGSIRVAPEDFVVDELLGFEPAGDGPHVMLQVRKCGANTEWVARELARHAKCRPFDVGFAGLKDRHAVTTQHFTVPRGRDTVESWLDVAGDGYEVLAATGHTRKLPRGALAGNRFELRIRNVRTAAGAPVAAAVLAARLDAIKMTGVPNYFGPQRFGRDANNLRSVAAGDLPRDRSTRGYVLSTARSLIFNAVLGERVRDGSWNQLLPGDAANLEGSGSVFPVTELDDALRARVLEGDLHPTGPLCGASEQSAARQLVGAAPALLEASVAARFPAALQLIERAAMKPERRALRLMAGDLAFDMLEASALRLRFTLPAGSFATTVLRELVAADNSGE